MPRGLRSAASTSPLPCRLVELSVDDDGLVDSERLQLFGRANRGEIRSQRESGVALSNNGNSSVAISGDGRTALVGARTEASTAAGINGNQNDNSGPEASAVYVFARNP